MHPIITDEDTGATLWRAPDCAEHCGVSRSTWHSYSRLKNVPKPVAQLDARSPLWDAEEVKAWHAARPGSPVPNAPTSQRHN